MTLKTTKGALLIFALATAACSSKQTIKDVDTELKNKQTLGTESLGKNKDGQYIIQKKENLASYLLSLQNEVYGLEEGIYGNKTYGNKGKYGVLEDCRIELRAKTNGKWEMVDSAPKNILSKEEAKITKKMGIDEKGDLVHLTEEELTHRIKRFERYKENYERQEEWYNTEIKACKVSLNNFVNHKFDQAPVPPKFPDYGGELKADMNSYLCQYVESDASLRTLIKTGIGAGWLFEDDLVERPYVNDESAKDSTGFRRSYVLRIGDWVLAYNYHYKYGDLMNTSSDGELKAWLHRSSESVAEKSQCLPHAKRWSTSRK